MAFRPGFVYNVEIVNTVSSLVRLYADGVSGRNVAAPRVAKNRART